MNTSRTRRQFLKHGMWTAAADHLPNVVGMILVLVIGHTLNFALSLSSGFIHGLRLNVIEFFKWGVKDEGTPYRPFARKESTSWTTSS